MDINIKLLLLDKGMLKSLKQSINPYAGRGHKVLLYDDSFQLSKLDNFKDILENNAEINFPDIIVKPFKTTKYYEVIDGRHRAVVSMIKGKAVIKCNILE